MIEQEMGLAPEDIRYSRKNAYMFTGKVRGEK